MFHTGARANVPMTQGNGHGVYENSLHYTHNFLVNLKLA